jgi:predicted transcriptional regulator with HTH domain
MLEQTTIDRSIEIKRSVAIRAMRRSNIRRKVTEYLCEISPNCSYTSEIAYHINATVYVARYPQANTLLKEVSFVFNG